MAMMIKPIGTEQVFTSANSFSTANNTTKNSIRVVNTGNTSQTVVVTNSVSSSQFANLTILPYTEVIIEKAGNNTLTASSGNLLGVLVAFTQ